MTFVTKALLEVRHPYTASKSSSKSSGLGLATFQKRLELTYMGRYEYKVEQDSDIYKCTLTIHDFTQKT